MAMAGILAVLLVGVGTAQATDEWARVRNPFQSPSAAPYATLKIAVKLSPPFVMQGDEAGAFTGFTIDIWERMKLSDYNEYRVYATDQEVLAAVSSGVADIGMAAISITKEREEMGVDFSHSFFESGFQVLTHSDMSAVTAVAKALASAMTLLNVFILLVILELVLCVACVIWIVEVVLCPDVSKTFVRRRPVKGILDAFRWVLLSLIRRGPSRPNHWVTRVIAVMLNVLSLLVVASLTAYLTALAMRVSAASTIQGIDDLHTRSVGTTKGSTAEVFLRKQTVYSRIVRYDNTAAMFAGFSRRDLDAIVYDCNLHMRALELSLMPCLDPILQYHVMNGQYSDRALIVGPIIRPQSYGFATREAAGWDRGKLLALRERINRAILLIRDDDSYHYLHQTYFSNIDRSVVRESVATWRTIAWFIGLSVVVPVSLFAVYHMQKKYKRKRVRDTWFDDELENRLSQANLPVDVLLRVEQQRALLLLAEAVRGETNKERVSTMQYLSENKFRASLRQQQRRVLDILDNRNPYQRPACDSGRCDMDAGSMDGDLLSLFLQSKACEAMLLRTAASDYSLERIYFYRHLCLYLSDTDPESCREQENRMLRLFVEDDAEHEVNISEELREELIEDPSQRDLWVCAHCEVSHMICRGEFLELSMAVTDLVKTTWLEAIAYTGPNGETMQTIFYTRLFSEMPEARNLFTSGDMSKQEVMFGHIMTDAVTILTNFEALVKKMAWLGERHRHLGIGHDHFATLGRCLVDTVEEVIGPERFNAETRSAWEMVYDLMSTIMLLAIDKNNMDILGITLRHRDESRAEKPGSRRQSRKRGSCCATSTGTPGDNYVAEETGSDELRVDVDGQQLALLLVPQRLGRRRLLLAILAALLLAVVLIVVVVVVVTQR
ncbi:Globin domain-containing protein [Plasmodiophora brassicae]